MKRPIALFRAERTTTDGQVCRSRGDVKAAIGERSARAKTGVASQQFAAFAELFLTEARGVFDEFFESSSSARSCSSLSRRATCFRSSGVDGVFDALAPFTFFVLIAMRDVFPDGGIGRERCMVGLPMFEF